MPDRIPPSENDGDGDSLRDLFANLPDPLAQESAPRSGASRSPATETGPAVALPLDTASTSVPGSRRAAREAAAQQGSGTGAVIVPSEQTAAVPDAIPAARPTPAQPAAVAWPLGDGGVHDVVPERATVVSANDQPAASTPPSSLEDLFAADDDSISSVGNPPRKKRRKGCLVALIILLVLLGGAVAGGVYVWSIFGDRISEAMGWGEPKDYESGLATGETLVTIADGDTGIDVSSALYRAGVTKTEDVFYDLLISTDETRSFFPGVYRLQEKMTAAAALDALFDPENKLENSVLIREGLSIAAILPILSESLNIPLADFEAAVADPAAYGVAGSSLEGWLFPALYEFTDPEVTAKDVIQRMVDRTRESLAAAGVPAGDEHRVLTIASIIQREARYEEDFFKVSRVIQNRMGPDNEETGGRLEMDSTVQYGYGQLHSGEASTSEEARNDDNPWNTYMHPGLPAGPIASPGDLAIEAAMKPAEGPWFYFVTVNMDTGETIFTSTYDEHLGYVEQMVKWCEENPDSGC